MAHSNIPTCQTGQLTQLPQNDDCTVYNIMVRYCDTQCIIAYLYEGKRGGV